MAKLREVDNGLELTLSDNKVLSMDHLILATGYQVDIKTLSMLSPSLLAEIQQDMGTPILNPWFESSVPGLYFMGLSSLRSFGPLYRFVVGAKAAAPRVASAAARRVARVSRTR